MNPAATGTVHSPAAERSVGSPGNIFGRTPDRPLDLIKRKKTVIEFSYSPYHNQISKPDRAESGSGPLKLFKKQSTIHM